MIVVRYGASILMSILRRRRQNVFLACEIKDKQLPRDHRYLVRVLLLGVVAARHVKWIGKVLLCNKD